ncbi:uncharacterized protein LOC119253495 [Talpa occidentalis]|uniref:uncharacterized protein LOC119253495 n=1 Tax=Talpa occidentalis TaxID=50954 RepID=UPI00188EBA29|nr:uncharacterized protein LOC119253495 [Talpa occidentalis]
MQEEAGGRRRGSWQLVFSGRVSLRLDLETRAWTAGRPGDRSMLEKWEEDTDMDAFLWGTSHRDWKLWLQRVAVHWGAPATKDLSPAAPSSASLCFSSALVCVWKVFRPPQRRLLRGVSVTSSGPCASVPAGETGGTTEHDPRQVWKHKYPAGALVHLCDHPRLPHPPGIVIFFITQKQRCCKEHRKTGISGHCPFLACSLSPAASPDTWSSVLIATADTC